MKFRTSSILITFLVAFLGSVLMTPSAEAATIADTTYAPRVTDPLHRKPGDGGPNLDIIIHAPGDPWMAKEAASLYDSEIGGIAVHFGLCINHPTMQCVQVHAHNYGKTNWYGRTQLLATYRNVSFNTYYRHVINHRAIACHELGHVLGMAHHSHYRGCLKFHVYIYTVPSLKELTAYRRAY